MLGAASSARLSDAIVESARFIRDASQGSRAWSWLYGRSKYGNRFAIVDAYAQYQMAQVLRRERADDIDQLFGSQALRGVCPVWPRDFPKTIEADLYPRHHPQTWSLLREALGSQSRFFRQNGYYLDCTDPGVATLPGGWAKRLIPFRTPRTGGVTAWCLEPHDLFVSKLAVWREKDQQFLAAMLRHKLAKLPLVLRRIAVLPGSSRSHAEFRKHATELAAQLHASHCKPSRSHKP